MNRFHLVYNFTLPNLLSYFLIQTLLLSSSRLHQVACDGSIFASIRCFLFFIFLAQMSQVYTLQGAHAAVILRLFLREAGRTIGVSSFAATSLADGTYGCQTPEGQCICCPRTLVSAIHFFLQLELGKKR